VQNLIDFVNTSLLQKGALHWPDGIKQATASEVVESGVFLPIFTIWSLQDSHSKQNPHDKSTSQHSCKTWSGRTRVLPDALQACPLFPVMLCTEVSQWIQHHTLP